MPPMMGPSGGPLVVVVWEPADPMAVEELDGPVLEDPELPLLPVEVPVLNTVDMIEVCLVGSLDWV